MGYNGIYCRYCKNISRKTVQSTFGEFETNYCKKFNRTYTDNSVCRSNECIYYEYSGKDVLKKERKKKAKETYTCPYCDNVVPNEGICSRCRKKLPLVRQIVTLKWVGK